MDTHWNTWAAALVALCALALDGCTASVGEPVGVAEAAVYGGENPIVWGDDPDEDPNDVSREGACQRLGLGTYELKIDAADLVDGATYPLGDGAVTVHVYGGNTTLDFEGSTALDAVIMKGGSGGALIYVYDPEATSGTGLHTPVNPSGAYAEISHVTFCFDYEVQVQKTAETSYERRYAWTIDKQGSVSSLLLSSGQLSPPIDYDVTLRARFADRDWAVSGAITVFNPDPTYDAIIEGIDDLMRFPGGDLPVRPDCGVTFPFVLASGETLRCTYAATLPSGEAGVNQAIVTTSGLVGGGEARAVIGFGEPSRLIDDCVSVDDDRAGHLGELCQQGGSFHYTLVAGPYEECGSSHEFVNTASFVTDDTGASGSDSWAVHIDIASCAFGCTLTPGYWKTHSSRGPAPYDETWALLPRGADTPFFLSGQTYYEVLWTPPAGGNAYYILARAYIAAVLNGLNGADLSSVAGVLAEARTYFASSGPTAPRGALRTRLLALAARLDAFNNGLIGPGHCSE